MSGRIHPSWRRLISPRPAMPMTARANCVKRRPSFECNSPAPRLSCTRTRCRGTRALGRTPRRTKGGSPLRAGWKTNPALYHLDSTIDRTPYLEIARSLRGRHAPPMCQMRHGHRGAAEIAQSLDNLYCFAALTDGVASAQFDLMLRRRRRSAGVSGCRAAVSHGRAPFRGGGEVWISLSRLHSARVFWLA